MTALFISSLVLLLVALAKLYKVPHTEEEPQVPVSPSTPLQSVPAAPQTPAPTLFQLCRVMRDFEGAPGDANYRNNNPLNCRYSPVGYLPKYQPVLKSPNGFAVFKDYSTGWLYGFEMLKHKIEKHPDWTLYDLVADHAPKSDGNDPVHYSLVIAKNLGVDNHFPLKNLVLA